MRDVHYKITLSSNGGYAGSRCLNLEGISTIGFGGYATQKIAAGVNIIWSVEGYLP